MFDKTQLMRGSLEGCILKIIEKETTYGYEILEQLKQIGFHEVSEGTIYPILLRLEKQAAISSKLQASPLGPKRKYYTITASGRAYLASFYGCWSEIHSIVYELFHDKEKHSLQEKEGK